MTRARVDIDLAAYRRNLDFVRERIVPAELLAVVKSDAYGHGFIPLARAAAEAGVTWLGALYPSTARELRAAGIDRRVRLLAWMYDPSERFHDAADLGIDLGVSSLHELRRISAHGGATPARIHLKIDTGLNRNGATSDDWPQLVEAAIAAERAGLVEIVGAWTHISEASDEQDTDSIARFHSAIALAEELGAAFDVRHLAASAASFARADSRFDLVRVGAFTLGIAPGSGLGPAEVGIEPVLTLSAPVVSVHDGSAAIAVGYGDGVSTRAVGRVSIAINGVRHPVVAVEVDRTVIEMAGSVSVGDTAYLFGPAGHGEATLQEWADATGTIGEELVVSLSPRLTRHYIG